MKLSVVIPVFNEIRTIEEILRRVQVVEFDKEIIVVDDGSTDGTREFLSTVEEKNVKVRFHDTNGGKGAAIRTGLNHVEGARGLSGALTGCCTSGTTWATGC